MDSFLRKYKLIDTLSLKLNCDKTTFIEKFKENVEPSDLSFTPFEAFSSGTKLLGSQKLPKGRKGQKCNHRQLVSEGLEGLQLLGHVPDQLLLHLQLPALLRVHLLGQVDGPVLVPDCLKLSLELVDLGLVLL